MIAFMITHESSELKNADNNLQLFIDEFRVPNSRIRSWRMENLDERYWFGYAIASQDFRKAEIRLPGYPIGWTEEVVQPASVWVGGNVLHWHDAVQAVKSELAPLV